MLAKREAKRAYDAEINGETPEQKSLRLNKAKEEVDLEEQSQRC